MNGALSVEIRKNKVVSLPVEGFPWYNASRGINSANVAQTVEQSLRKRSVKSSILFVGLKNSAFRKRCFL
jgi:hypothetical protein